MENPPVVFEPKDQLVFVRLENGQIDLSVYFSNECESPDDLVAAMEAWIDDTDTAVIKPHFRISSIVDYVVVFHEIWGSKNKVDAEAKPLLDAIKREMLEQIARIDALSIVSDETEADAP